MAYLEKTTTFLTYPTIRYGDDPAHLMTALLPMGEGPFPALVVIHGGGWARGDRYKDDVFPLAKMYAERGIAGFSIDYQLSAPGAPSWPANIQDVICAIRHIKEQAKEYNIDPDRVAVLGHSAGGHLASLVGTLQGDEPFLVGGCGNPDISSRVVLVVNYAGPGDADQMAKLSSRSARRVISQLVRSTYRESPDQWRQAFPNHYISLDDPVFVIVHGTKDDTVPFKVSVSFAKQLKSEGVETHLVLIEGAGHGISADEEQNLEVRHVLEPIMRRLLQP